MASSRSSKKKREDLKDKIKTTMVILFLIFLFFGGFIIEIIDGMTPRDSLLRQVSISPAVIAEISNNSGKTFVRVHGLTNNVSEDNSWIEVVPEFAMSHFNGQQVGVLIGDFDVFKAKFLSKDKEFENSELRVIEIYDSYEQAMTTNSYSNYNREVNIVKKMIDPLGKMYFVINVDGEKMQEEVDIATYDKYNVGDKYIARFESIGSFRKYIGVAM